MAWGIQFVNDKFFIYSPNITRTIYPWADEQAVNESTKIKTIILDICYPLFLKDTINEGVAE